MAGPTEKSGTIATTETWNLDGSPYLIIDNISVDADVDVFVEAGVRIEVQKEDATITLAAGARFVYGGTREEPIHVHGQTRDPKYWTGFVMTTADCEVRASYTTFENAAKLFGLDTVQSLLWLEDSIFRNCALVCEQIGFDQMKVYIARNVFERNATAFKGRLYFIAHPDIVQVAAGDFFSENHFRDNDVVFSCTESTGLLVIRGNWIYRNRQYAVWTKSGAVMNATVKYNWFGSDSGPYEETSNPQGTGDVILIDVESTVLYDPWTIAGRYVPIPDDAREFASRILREGTPSGEETTAIALTDDELRRILDRAEKYVDSWLTDDVVEKRLLAYGEETNETRDRTLGESYVRTRYRPIVALSAVERRTGAASWTAVSENELSGYYASETDKRRGLVHFADSPIYELDSVRLSYTHGYYDAPEDIRDAVLKLAAFSIFQTILKPGEPDAFTSRVSALEREIETLRERFEGTKKGPSYVVI